MVHFNSKLSLVLGLCAAVALANVGGQADTGVREVHPEILCKKGHCYPKLFRPTTEFQEILEGQEIPPGLHVKMDYQTHRKFAKLIDPEEPSQENDSNSILVVDTDTPGTVQHQIESQSEETEETEETEESEESEETEETEQETPQEETDDFTQMEEASRQNLQLAFDSIPELNEVMHQGEHQLFDSHIETIRSNQDPEIVAGALEELLYLSSDMEFGLLLVNGERLKTLVKLLYSSPDLGGPQEEARRAVRIGAAAVLGTAVQNHEKAQEVAFKAKLHKVFLERLENETDRQVLRRLIFAYASLGRGGNSNPDHMIVQDDDIARLAEIFKKSDDYFFRRKCIYLMSDFADPDMQHIVPDDDKDSETTSAPSNEKWERPAVNVGPWCEALQEIDLKKGHDEDEHPDWLIIEEAIKHLHGSYPETCILKSSRTHDEL